MTRTLPALARTGKAWLVAGVVTWAALGAASASHGTATAARGVQPSADQALDLPARRAGRVAAPTSGRVLQSPAPFEARSIAIDDGDSFVVRRADGTKLRIRLAGIDAPEKSQPWANVAREKLAALLDKRALSISALKIDPWGRLVALVDIDGEDVALAMLDAGLAWHYTRYDRDLPAALRERYARAATRARREHLGLWRAARPEPPWEFRRRSR